MVIKLNDVSEDGFRVSLSKLIGKEIKDVVGYISSEYGPGFALLEIVFEDGTQMGVEGEHDYPYLVQYRSQEQPNFDDETLTSLEKECYGGETE